MKWQLKASIGIVISGLVQLTNAGQFEFNGYMRAGVGLNSKGGTQVCFGLPGADTKWRLGNECDYVIEPNLIYQFGKQDDGSSWKVQFMPSVYRAWGQNEFGDDIRDNGVPVGKYHGTDELITRMGQVFIASENIPQLGDGGVWAGRRFYDRVQLGINDQFLENHDGDGAGIENIHLGDARLSYALLMNPRAGTRTKTGINSANNQTYEHAFRLTDIKTVTNGSLAIYAGHRRNAYSPDIVDNVEHKSDKTYSRIGVYHNLATPSTGGSNFLGFKYEKQDQTKIWRVVTQQTGMIASVGTGWDLITEYRVTDNNSKQEKWFSIGARTDTHVIGPFRFLVELGNDQVKPNEGETRNMTKLTLMGAISAGKDPGSRPTFRLFYTYAKWNEAARKVLANNWITGDRTNRVYGNDTSGASIGAQVEAWW
ncbi:carbohydrate porin [Chitinivorax sp. B]|uniref:carbohydrate porin n=1 Tax=Chitinivorax sp. B TaxID=2502235 RepID=UPI0010F726E8|nr:carbohydrate porin [Chitinivorax sp. B]